ncbi:unnamed protein product [Cylindrotheca closterium]|uniref:Uncharacterized protein n=1 Tax=Cylindrotheca closterium TaxID=2856 RepID=A0AAD2CHC0_9STRA|nr:unnamed protein product [Cylindrotheca closterium]
MKGSRPNIKGSQAKIMMALIVFWLFFSRFPEPTKKSSHFTTKYIPSRLEHKMMQAAESELGYNRDAWVDGCTLYRNQSGIEFYNLYQGYVSKLEKYTESVKKFRTEVKDIRLLPKKKREKLCQKMDKVLYSAFRPKHDCSLTDAGYVEPLLPPLRHPHMCASEKKKKKRAFMSLDYLVHDFGKICRQLEPGARTVFFDLGASLVFHGYMVSPAMTLVKLFNQFGIKFDHYYAFEYSVIDPKLVYGKIPEELMQAYHWYNVPVEASPTSKQNPWKTLLSKYNASDFVVIKLDIDTASLELPLTHELLQDKYSPLVDQFYFEHHVKLHNLRPNWKNKASGTIKYSLDLFTSLRKVGIASHSWV